MVSMRAAAAEWDLIDRAATACGKTRTAFVIEAARRQAEDVLKERTDFSFSPSEWTALKTALDAPVKAHERRKVAKLLAEKPLWERAK